MHAIQRTQDQCLQEGREGQGGAGRAQSSTPGANLNTRESVVWPFVYLNPLAACVFFVAGCFLEKGLRPYHLRCRRTPPQATRIGGGLQVLGRVIGCGGTCDSQCFGLGR